MPIDLTAPLRIQRIPGAILDPWARDLLKAHALRTFQEKGALIAVVDTAVMENLINTYFATSAGPDLAFLATKCKEYRIDMLEIDLSEAKVFVIKNEN